MNIYLFLVLLIELNKPSNLLYITKIINKIIKLPKILEICSLEDEQIKEFQLFFNCFL